MTARIIATALSVMSILSFFTRVDMSGSNAMPSGYGSFHYEIENIFIPNFDNW